MKSKVRIFLPILIVILVSIACTWSGAGSPLAGGDSTSVAATILAQFTQDALKTAFAQLQGTQTPVIIFTPEMAATATANSGQTIPSATTTPTSTVVQPTATNTLIPPTSTNTPIPPTSTQRPPTWTSTPIPCNWVLFITDVTIPDGTTLNPGATFTKTWRLKNAGSCTWSADYALIFDHGTQFNAPAAQNLGASVAPGQTIDISVAMTAPSAAGAYTGYFKLRTNGAVSFGIGAGANLPFWVSINVAAPASSPTPTATVNPVLPQDFAALRCSASWASAASPSLACSGSENFSTGSVSYTTTPIIEISYQDDEATLILIPSNGASGWITGTYPPFLVQAGDHFSALTGCYNSSANCSVVFYVNYVEVGNPTVQTLQTWTEVYDGNRTSVNIDLTPLAGKTVKFILTVGNSNGVNTDDRAFWEAAKIVR